MFRNARAFHTFFLGISQVPEPRKVWCPKWSVWHSSWLCTAFFYSTVFNSLNRTTFNSGLEFQGYCNGPPIPVFERPRLDSNQRPKISMHFFSLPTELRSHLNGADSGSWTRIASLGSWSSNHWTISAFGALDGIRTHTPKGTAAWRQRVCLFHHKSIKWCSRRDSNSYAIKHQLLRLTCLPLPSQEQIKMEELTGFEPAIMVLQTTSLTTLGYNSGIWRWVQDSNLRSK